MGTKHFFCLTAFLVTSLFSLSIPQVDALQCALDCNIIVNTHGTFAEFQIKTPEDVAGFMVIVSKDPPQSDGAVNTEVSRQGIAGPIAQASIKVRNLKPDTQYFYQVLAVQKWPGPGGNMFSVWGTRQFGAFWTKMKHVTVEFTEVHMIDDSDDLSGGDMTFLFWLNGQPDRLYQKFPDDQIDSGEAHTLDVKFSKDSPQTQNLPNEITVQIYGKDEDPAHGVGGALDLCRFAQVLDSPPSSGKDDTCFESAAGQTKLNLTTELYNLEKAFVIKAKEDWLEFDIHGRCLVEYVDASPPKPLPQVTQPPLDLTTWIGKPTEEDCTQPDWQPEPDSPYCTAVPLEILSSEPDKSRLLIEWQKRWQGNWIPYCKPPDSPGLGSVEWFQKCNNFYRDHDPAKLDVSIPHAGFPVTKCQRVRATSIHEDTGIKSSPSKWRTFYVPPARPFMVNTKVVTNQSRFSPAGYYSVKFTWTAGCADVTEWFLGVGTSQQSIENAPYGDIYAETLEMSNSSVTVTRIPEHGKVYVRLWYQLGGNWEYTDYTYPSFKFPSFKPPNVKQPSFGHSSPNHPTPVP